MQQIKSEKFKIFFRPEKTLFYVKISLSARLERFFGPRGICFVYIFASNSSIDSTSVTISKTVFFPIDNAAVLCYFSFQSANFIKILWRSKK